ncbi:arylacetamide deacetylase [Aspergillus steynii IBT 23096]|uniref:Arylacetamide deacetylase n=1 Tax=Aspergillus steynii IBT 23096 TaxID=1392250 RepID=A0A2I2GQX8_9EURO|nr:arylacetamide deacetylase [Aspergillus steynii IBT 23096]PLB55289.1 arylacetamide deacetylase [Aspergillus steynii IBT 23096]
MPLNTVALSFALTPAVLSTFVSHYIHRKSLHHKPNVHVSYDEGIRIFREFLAYASKHTVEDIQAFTTQWVPSPHWVRTETITIPNEYLAAAATALVNELGPHGIKRVGGKEWWQWRGPAEDLKGEWIEMRNDHNERKRANGDHPSQKRIMLYIHGGAYYFGSIDTHRYQMQRHARKLKGRMAFVETDLISITAQYRLAPQYPFPCALQDSLSAYLFLLNQYKPNEIIFAGDSAGGALVLSMLVTVRDQGLPLPAGAILISPWVDLTHSFPSIVKDNPGDYIPPYGFRHKPSEAWPPPTADEVLSIKEALGKKRASETKVPDAKLPAHNRAGEAVAKGYSVEDNNSPLPDAPTEKNPDANYEDSYKAKVPMDGKTVEVKDQIHMYTTNQLLSHPLVSPVMQSSLGGLPPLQIMTGGGEMLRDEQIYLAHKAANPTAYPPSDTVLDEHDPNREVLHKYPGTYVQLQVWDDLCHVAPTLSFTRPAKYMYRSIAQFGAWALACAQESQIDILDDNAVSPISSSDSDTPETPADTAPKKLDSDAVVSSVGVAGDPLPPFKDRMVRQRVDKRGRIYPLPPPSSYSILQLPSSHVGSFNPELVKKWLAGKEEWDVKFAKEKLRVQQQRLKELAYGFEDFENEFPPPCSLAARKEAPGVLPSRNGRKSYPMTLWSHWASRHDEKTIQRERQKDSEARRTSVEAGKAGASLKRSGDPNLPAIDVEKANEDVSSAERNSPDTTSTGTQTRLHLLDKTTSPLIVLPAYESRRFGEEAASTQSLFHAPGIIAPTSDPYSTRHRPRPSSHAGSGTIRSGMTSDVADAADDVSTLGDRSLAVTNTGVDAASTRAVLNAAGVVNTMNDADSKSRSVEALSMSHGSGGFASTSSLGTKSEVLENGADSSRPGMPERDVFRTADEYIPGQ